VAPRPRRFGPPIGRGRAHAELVDRVATFGIPVVVGLCGSLLVGFPVGLLAGAALGYVVARVFVLGSGRLVERSQSGATTPHKPDYSVPESLVARGDFARAIDAYEECVWASPKIPDPYVSIARLYRDRLRRPRDAEQWFKRARSEATLSAGLDLLITQELIGLYVHALREPRKAIPELAHVCSAHPHTPAARGAELELLELRSMLAREASGGESVTEQYLKKHRPPRGADEPDEFA
jgi:hypothetical protein